MNKLLSFIAISALSVNTMAYDHTKAKNADEFYSKMTQKALANSTLSIDANEVMKMLRQKDEFVLLDIRTPQEMSVLGLKTKNSIEIAIEDLFKETNLDKLPSDKPIIVVCYSGSRALLASVELKRMGFNNIRYLKGGISSLATANNVKNAPSE